MDPGPTPHLDGVRARVAERLRGLRRCDVPGDDLHVESFLDRANGLDDPLRVSVGGVDDEHVDVLVDERGSALERVRSDADRGPDPKATLVVLRGVRILDPLLDVLDRDQATQVAVTVDDRQLLDPVAMEDAPRLVERRPDRRR